jgi:hypothetical protein
MRKVLGWGLAAALTGGVALAEDVQVEVSILDASQVTLHIYPFLKAEELATLRLVATNRDALSVFVPSKDASHFAALALAPADGFLQDGAPAATAVALSDFPDAQAANTAALAACDAQRDPSTEACVVVLEVGPAP